MSTTYRNTIAFTIFITIMQFSKLSAAQSVTIGGTPSDAPSTGFMSMFMGDLFTNFRHMERFAPVSTMLPSPNPWQLNSELVENIY